MYSDGIFRLQAVKHLPYLGGRTNTTAALNLLRRTVFQTSAGDRPTAPNVAVLVANGESTLDRDRVSTEAAACRDAGITMVVVAADRTMMNSVELRSIVSPPTRDNYFTATSLSALPNITQSVVPAMLLCPGFSYESLPLLYKQLQCSPTLSGQTRFLNMTKHQRSYGTFCQYTVGHSNRATLFQIISLLFHGQFRNFVSLKTGMNTPQRRNQICNFLLTMSPHCLVKTANNILLAAVRSIEPIIFNYRRESANVSLRQFS